MATNSNGSAVGNFFKLLGSNLLNNALQGAATASANNGSIKDIGVAASITSLIGLLQLLTTHSVAASPAVQAVIAPKAPPV